MLLIDEQRKWFLEIESTRGEDTEDTVKTVEMTTKDLEYYVKLVDKATAGSERTDSSFKRNSIVGKRLQMTLHATEKLFVKGRLNWYSKFQCSLLLRGLSW